MNAKVCKYGTNYGWFRHLRFLGQLLCHCLNGECDTLVKRVHDECVFQLFDLPSRWCIMCIIQHDIKRLEGLEFEFCVCCCGVDIYKSTSVHSLWGVHDFTHSLYTYITEFVSLRTMFMGLFAWINLTACIGLILLSKAWWYAKLYMVTCTSKTHCST